jgi:YD repeat-containing protein
MGVPTVTRHDRLGRVFLARTGFTTGAVVAATHFGRGGVVDSVRAYATNGAVDASPVDSIQVTRYYYSPLGWVDSSRTAGGRVQAYLRDRLGNPIYEFTGHGAYVGRAYDWQGRLTSEFLSQVQPGYSVDGRSFADSKADSIYRSFNMGPGVTWSGTALHQYSYDQRSRIVEQDDSLVTTRRAFNARGAVVADTVTFADGARVMRVYS